MMESLFEVLKTVPVGVAYLSLGILLLLVSRMVMDLITPFRLDDQLTGEDNPALGLSFTGYYLSVIAVFLGALYEPNGSLSPYETLTIPSLLMDMGVVLGYSVGGVLLLNLSRWLLDKLVLRHFHTRKEIIEDRNSGTGAVEFGNYLASGLLIAGAISGEMHGPWWKGAVSALVFFGVGQIMIILYAVVYQWVTPYDIHAEIEKDNVPAGVAFGGNLVAMGIVLLKSLGGDFVSWEYNLAKFVVFSLVGIVLLFAVRFLVDRLFLPSATIHEEIVRDRNINAAYQEGGILIGTALILFFSL